MQSSSARIGLIVLLVLIAAAAYVAVDHPLGALRATEQAPAAATATAAQASAPAAVEPIRATQSVPITPVYVTRPEPAASPIYRCRSGSRTVYTQEPCENGRIVVTANAVDGYETKPSDRLERLVADGRTTSAPPSLDAPARLARTPAAPTSVECATYAQQISDLDAEALLPNTPRGLDRIRRIRQDVRTSMARQHC